jgi:hypothetical protein
MLECVIKRFIILRVVQRLAAGNDGIRRRFRVALDSVKNDPQGTGPIEGI